MTPRDVRIVHVGSQRFTRVVSIDEQGPGGAYHEYQVETMSPSEELDVLAKIKFQKGGVVEAGGVNGMFIEDLLAVVVDRLECFQAGPFNCRENALALTKIEEALHWLNHRTAKRQARGVEGVSVK